MSSANITGAHRDVGPIIDRLVTVEVRAGGSLPAGVIAELHEAARRAEGGSTTLGATEALEESIDEGDTVLITSGAGGPPWLPNGENDGPLGVVGLARALTFGLGARPVLVTEERCIPPMNAIARACGMEVVTYNQLRDRTGAVAVESFPESREEARSAANEFLRTYDPAAIIAVEKLGPNREGIYHSILGHDHSENHSRIDELFVQARQEGVLTVGFGDGGNEIGFGKIEDAVREIQPYGDVCECPCKSGVATHVETDHLVVGGTSNWAAYGVEAMLALRAGNPQALHSVEDERRMLEQAMMKGSLDGLYARPRMGVDGSSEETTCGIVAILNDIVESRLTEVDRDF